MKSIETQLEEVRESIFAAETLKGFSEDASRTGWNDRMKSAASVEEKLSIAKKHAASLNIKESKPRVHRNNGSGVSITESEANDQRVRSYMKKVGVNFREASVICGLPDPGPREPKSMIEARRDSWKKYAPFLSESECQTLAERGVEP